MTGNTTRGLFVVFEGGDGAGKTTQLQRLAQWLTTNGHEVVVTFEPGDTALGATLRKVLLDPASGDVSPRAEAMMYAADKAQHIQEVIEPALAAGKIVLCDRFIDSMLAYQGAGRVLAIEDVRYIIEWATSGLEADLTVLLDVPVEDAVGRIAEQDRLEAAGNEFHQRVRSAFLALAEQRADNHLVINARDSRDSIEQTVRHHVLTLLAHHG